jgi:hypothetical protein
MDKKFDCRSYHSQCFNSLDTTGFAVASARRHEHTQGPPHDLAVLGLCYQPLLRRKHVCVGAMPHRQALAIAGKLNACSKARPRGAHEFSILVSPHPDRGPVKDFISCNLHWAGPHHRLDGSALLHRKGLARR